MTRLGMRFSLRWLFGAVFYAAAGCAILAAGRGSLYAACNFAFAVLCLVALLGAIYTQHERSAFWSGCAIVGWSLMLSSFLPNNQHAPYGAIEAVLYQLSSEHLPWPKIRESGAEAFVAIGCSIAGGLLARWFWSRSTSDRT